MLGGYGHVRLERVYEIVYTLEYIYIYIYFHDDVDCIFKYKGNLAIYVQSQVPNAQMEQYIFFLPSNTKYMQDI